MFIYGPGRDVHGDAAGGGKRAATEGGPLDADRKGTARVGNRLDSVTVCRRGKPVLDIVRTSRKPASEIEFGVLSHLKVELDSDWWKPMSKEEAEVFLEGRR